MVSMRVSRYTSFCDGAFNVIFEGFGGNVVVRAYSIEDFYGLYGEVKKAFPFIMRMVGLYALYDLQSFVSTHHAMNRRIARLNKLLRILDKTYLEFGGSRWCVVPYSRVVEPLYTILKNIVLALEHVRGSVHRFRDKVHEFVFPVLQTVLELLMSPPRIVFPVGYYSEYKTDDQLNVMFVINSDRFYHIIDVGDGELKYLSDNPMEVRSVARKRFVRYEKRMSKVFDNGSLFIPWRTLVRWVGKNG